MSLPNPSMDFTPFDVLTAAELDDLVENDQALAAGTGLNNNSVIPGKWTNPYCFRIYLTNSYGPATSGDKQLFTTAGATEVYDYNSNMSNLGVYTVPFNGVYHFDLTARQSSAIGLTLAFYKNGALYQYLGSTSTGNQRVSGGLDVLLATSDTVEMWINVSAAATITNGDLHTNFCGHLVHKT